MHVFWITKAIAQGGYLLDEDFAALRTAGVTHVLNLDLPYRTVPSEGLADFSAIHVQTIPDGQPIPEEKAYAILDTIHRAVSESGAKLYVHCSAGISRSPTIVWLYLIACGLDVDEVARRIVAGAPLALPGNPALVYTTLLANVRAHGSARYQPHPRPEVLEWMVD